MHHHGPRLRRVQGKKHTPSVKLSLKAHTDLDTGASVDKTFYADLWLSDKCIDRTCATLPRDRLRGQQPPGPINEGQVLVERSARFRPSSNSTTARNASA